MSLSYYDSVVNKRRFGHDCYALEIYLKHMTPATEAESAFTTTHVNNPTADVRKADINLDTDARDRIKNIYVPTRHYGMCQVLGVEAHNIL